MLLLLMNFLRINVQQLLICENHFMSINNKQTFTAFLFVLVFSACTSPKQILYFQDLKSSARDTLVQGRDYRIQPKDILQVTVTSLNAEMDEVFSRSALRFEENGNLMTGYVVDSAGVIGLPYAGYLKVAGMTLFECRKLLTDSLSAALRNPIVNIRIANYSISILGEVNRAGTFQFPQDLVTVPQALSLAGDLTINARRDSVLLIREIDGVRSYQRFDLRRSDLFASPIYYLQNRDIIYVPPAKSKIAQTDTRRWQWFAFATTVLSLTTVIISRVN